MGDPVIKGKAVHDFGRKEGLIFSLIREVCPEEKISFRVAKGGKRRHFKVQCRAGHVYHLNFSESFLYSRDWGELKNDLHSNLEYLNSAGCSAKAFFNRNCIHFEDLEGTE